MRKFNFLFSVLLAVGLLFSTNTWAEPVTTTETLQTALDAATEGTTIEIAAGTYGTVYLRNNGTDANRIMKGVTIKAASGATVKIAQIKYQKVNNKYLDIENLTIDGLEFIDPEKTAVLFDVDGNGPRVNGVTIQNCKKVGNKSNGTQYDNAAFFGGYYDGATAIGATFAGDPKLTRGYHDIKILNNTIEKVLQPIKFPNDGPLYGLTVSGNTFTDCQDNHFMLSTKTTGTVTIANNTIDKMTGRFARIAGAQADAIFVFENNKITNPYMYDTGGDGDIVKITGGAFTIQTNNGNDWVVKTNTSGTWITEATNVAKIGTKLYASLAGAIAAVKDGETITIIDDINVTGWVTINKPAVAFTIDLNGNKIERTDGSIFDIYSKVTFKDSQTGGTIKAHGRGLYCNAGADCTLESGKVIGTDGSAVNIYGAYGTGVAKFTMNGGSITAEDKQDKGQGIYMDAQTQGAEFVMNGGTITSAAAGIAWWGNNTEDAVKITINAGTITGAGSDGALSGNGSKSGANITIKKGTFICANGPAMYLPYHGQTTIEGGTFTGTTGLLIKDGVVNISGGTFTATGDEDRPTESVSSGGNNTGDAIYVEDSYGKSDYTFKHEITLNISGGTFTSQKAYALAAGFVNTDKKAAQIKITGGQFMSATDKAMILTEQDFKGSIVASAGVYNLAPAQDYIEDGKSAVANTDEETKTDYPWMIGVEPVKPLEEVTIDKDVTYTDKDGNTSSVENVATIVSNVVTNNDGTSITQSETGDWKVKTAKPEAGEAQDYSGSSTMVDTKSITVVLTSAVVETNVTISETQYNTVVTSMTFDVTPKVKVITQKTGEAACTTQVEVKTFAEPITFRLPVDKSYAGKYMKVWHQATDAADKTKWDLVGGYLVETTGEGDAMKGYIELAAKEFSFYKVEGNLWQYERTLDGYTIGTICLPRKSCSTSGAKFYRVADKKMNGSEISSIDLEEVQEDLAAGRPYVFIATSGSTKVVVCSEQEEDAVESPEASSANNGLAGTFSELTLSAFSSENQALIFYNDQLYTSVDGDKIPVNCAYILADQIKSTKQNAPRIRLYNMDAQGTTAVDNVVVVEEDAVIYDMLGHRLQEISAPGLYIVNGQKVFIKK